MLKNYFKIAIRNLLKQRGYSLINIGGLTIGITCCLLIFQYVVFEYSFDDFNENAPDLYRVNVTTTRSGGDPNTTPTFGWAMAPKLAQETPEVMRFARLHPECNNAVISNPAQPGKTFEEEGVYYTDPAFLQMFSYPLISDDPARALTEPGTIIIGFVIASPVAWYGMNRWLEDFAYRIELQWWIFALAGLIAVIIALMTVSFQSVKAALTNPVKSLRSE